MSHKILGDMKGLYAEMHEDAILKSIVEEIIYTVSFSMLSEGKTVEEIVEVLGSDDENIIIEKYKEVFKSKTLTEDFDFESHTEDIVLIYEGLGSLALRGLWGAGKGVVKGVWNLGKGLVGLAPKAVQRFRKPKNIKQLELPLRTKGGMRPANTPIRNAVDDAAAALKSPTAKNLAKGALIAGGGALATKGIIDLTKGEDPKKDEKSEVKATDSLSDKVKDPEKKDTEKKDTKIDYTKIFPKGIPDYSGVFKNQKSPKPEKETETLPDRVPSQLGDKTPYSKKATEKMSKRTRRILSGQSVYDRDPRAKAGRDPRYEAYDVVLDYLLSEGHAETVEEAHYVMMQMDAEHIQSIVESGYFPTPESQRADERRHRLSRDRLPGEHKPQKPEKKVEEQMMPPIDPVKHKQAQKTQKIYNLGKGTNNPNEAQSAMKRTGPTLPPV